jgi:hypothetical protein
VAGSRLQRRPVFDGDPPVDDGNTFQHLISHLRLRLSRPAATLLHRVGLERSESSGRLRARQDGPLKSMVDFAASCQRSAVVAVGWSMAESSALAFMELACAQNRFLTLGTRVGRGLLLALREHQSEQWEQRPKCSCKDDDCRHPWSQRDNVGAQPEPSVKNSIRDVLWACKEAALLAWLENVKGICAVPAPQPLRHNIGRAVLGRAMRLWGQVRSCFSSHLSVWHFSRLLWHA